MGALCSSCCGRKGKGGGGKSLVVSSPPEAYSPRGQTGVHHGAELSPAAPALSAAEGGLSSSAAKPSVPSGPSAYLMYNSGEKNLILHYSKKELSDAIVVARPRKAIPEHKFTSNAGRTILTKKGASDAITRGCSAFCQNVKPFNVELVCMKDLSSLPQPVGIYCYNKDGKITSLHRAGDSLDMTNVTAVCTCRGSSNPFASRGRVTGQDFGLEGGKAGYCVNL